MPDFWGFTTADLIDVELSDVPKQMLASLVNILAKKVVKVEEDFALLDIEYTQTCEELGDLTRNQPGVRRPKVIDSKCL